ncbi:MAG: thioredoxin family protein [Odoribacteraceae bacterium]|jgi:thiol-disulfide isomerase/thioredoxin|nr:thioredoxin family protein [Odoribacteraceae bacterium]
MGSVFSLSAQEERKTNEGIQFMANEPWTTVVQQAKEQNRLIFMDCYTTWCGPCKGLAENIFPQKAVGDFFNAHFVNVQYDMEKGDGKMLNEKYKAHIIGYPTLLLINAEGQVVHQMAGYQEADVLIAGMKAGLEGRSLFAVQDRYEKGARDLETITAYVDALNGAFQKEKIPGVVEAFLATIPVERLLEPEVWQVVGKYIKDPYTEQYRFVLQNLGRGYQYRLKVDRYALETQLASGMLKAVEEILTLSRATRDADTLALLREREGKLKELLLKYQVKEYPTFVAKLEINDLILAGEPLETYRLLASAQKMGVFPSNSNSKFLSGCYRYIVENIRDKKILRACIDELLALQEKQTLRVEYAFSYHDVLALAHEKLKDHAAAQAAREEYERRETAKKEHFSKMFDTAKTETTTP